MFWTCTPDRYGGADHSLFRTCGAEQPGRRVRVMNECLENAGYSIDNQQEARAVFLMRGRCCGETVHDDVEVSETGSRSNLQTATFFYLLLSV